MRNFTEMRDMQQRLQDAVAAGRFDEARTLNDALFAREMAALRITQADIDAEQARFEAREVARALDDLADALTASAYGVTVKAKSWVRAFRLGHGTGMLDLDPRTGEWACFCEECLETRNLIWALSPVEVDCQ